MNLFSKDNIKGVAQRITIYTKQSTETILFVFISAIFSLEL